MNVKSDSRGKVGCTTYIVLIALQCLGLPLAFLVSPPQKVIHSDGRRGRRGRVVAKKHDDQGRVPQGLGVDEEKADVPAGADFGWVSVEFDLPRGLHAEILRFPDPK